MSKKNPSNPSGVVTLDRPARARFGVVANGDRNLAWLDQDDDCHRWMGV